jgi:hypothetical protein
VAEHHYYATLTPISADDSKILLIDGHGDWYVIDPLGNVVVAAADMPAMNPGVILWDATDGSVFYFTKGHSLMKGIIRGNAVKSSVVNSFSEYQAVVLPDKTDLSINGHTLALWGGTTSGNDPLNIFTYDMQTKTKKTPYATVCAQNAAFNQGPCVHGITITADDNVIIDFASDGTCTECGNRLWDGKKLVHLQDATNHLDTGYDLSGAPIFIAVANRSTLPGLKNPCSSGWGLDVRQIYNMQSAVCLLDHQPSWHVSYRGDANQPWVALSFFDDRKAGPEFFNDNPTFQPPSRRNWQLYEDEIIVARIDGSATYRLAHARSRSAESYWAQPHAAITRDGKYVIFDSNMAYPNGCPSGIRDCSDVYLIKVQ